MARIRSVHPGLFTDESFVQLTPSAQVFWIGLWTEADDRGVFEWKTTTLKMRILPASINPVGPLLAELVELDCIRAFEIGGKSYGAIRNFQKFQRPKKPNQVHPLPPELAEYVGSTATNSEPAKAQEPAEEKPDAALRGASSEPAAAQAGVSSELEAARACGGSEAPIQMEDGGWRREKEVPSPLRSDGAAAAQEDDPPPTAEQLVWSEGKGIVARLTRKGRDHAGGLIGKWARELNGDWDTLWDILCAARDKRPGEPVAWIEKAVQARRERGLFDADDPWGLNAWIARQSDAVLGIFDGEKLPALGGFDIADTAQRVAAAAGLPPSWRGNWNAFGDWLRDRLDVAAPRTLHAIADQAGRLGSISSLAVFDATVRKTAGKWAA